MRVNSVDTCAVAGSATKMPEPLGKGHKKDNSAKGNVSDKKENTREITREEVVQAVDQLNKTMKAYSTELHFEIHEKSGEVMVKVINKDDHTVIREIPPEKVLNMVAYFKEALGIIVDKFI